MVNVSFTMETQIILTSACHEDDMWFINDLEFIVRYDFYIDYCVTDMVVGKKVTTNIFCSKTFMIKLYFSNGRSKENENK